MVCAEGILASSVHVNVCGGSAFYVVLVHKLYANEQARKLCQMHIEMPHKNTRVPV